MRTMQLFALILLVSACADNGETLRTATPADRVQFKTLAPKPAFCPSTHAVWCWDWD